MLTDSIWEVLQIRTPCFEEPLIILWPVRKSGVGNFFATPRDVPTGGVWGASRPTVLAENRTQGRISFYLGARLRTAGELKYNNGNGG